jgi:3-oxoadipate enol-lactonase
MARLELGDARLHYRSAGAGRPLVFLHGVGSSSHTWEGQLARFSSKHLCVAPDMRGYAGSRASPGTVSMRRFAADVAALIEHLGPGPADVCGLSMGGIVALTLWRDAPRRVRSLVLCDTWANHPAAAATHPQRMAAIDAGSMPELARTRMPGVYAPGADPALVERGVAAFAALDKAAYRAASDDLWTQDLREVAKTVNVPTLVVVGEFDTTTPPPLSEELAALIPGARLVVIPGAAHLTNEENPAAFDSALEEFLGA